MFGTIQSKVTTRDNMKQIFACTVSLLLASHCLAFNPYFLSKPGKFSKNAQYITRVTEQMPRHSKVGIDLCPTCVQFTDEAIEQLLNIILNVGVVSTCGSLCGLLANKTNSQALGAVCNILCDVVGIEAFINLIQQADLDPIYFCELITVCKVFDGGDAKFTSISINPTQGTQGTNFMMDVEYTSKNGTGTGELILEVETVDGIPVSGGFLLMPQQPGQYGQKITIKARPDPNCDPTQQPCEMWVPGVYNVKVAICNGECGSKHPHSQIYDQGMSNFTLTG